MPGYPTRKLLFGGPETLTLAGVEKAMLSRRSRGLERCGVAVVVVAGVALRRMRCGCLASPRQRQRQSWVLVRFGSVEIGFGSLR
ncbi:hypothetical protein MKX07_003546 [Trichoderma sp. CBMAI-0711]|nr:hypothetical protein MKX07_003546 [Trichoderma sp. CBMAI-0711]